MKSLTNQKQRRGYLPLKKNQHLTELSSKEIKKLLLSKIATERTLGARILRNKKDKNSITILLEALKIEKKLYTKIEICKALESIGTLAIGPLIELLGTIGNNQHSIVPDKAFRKNNYPLPRDIVARTLIRFKSDALPYLLPLLKIKNLSQLSEVIDTIGFICFYEHNDELFKELKKCMITNKNSELICWKLVRALSSFNESIEYLKDKKQEFTHLGILREIDRSIAIISKRLQID